MFAAINAAQGCGEDAQRYMSICVCVCVYLLYEYVQFICVAGNCLGISAGCFLSLGLFNNL